MAHQIGSAGHPVLAFMVVSWYLLLVGLFVLGYQIAGTKILVWTLKTLQNDGELGSAYSAAPAARTLSQPKLILDITFGLVLVIASVGAILLAIGFR